MATVALSSTVFLAADGDTYISSAQAYDTVVFLNDNYDADADVVRVEATSTGKIEVKDAYGRRITIVPAESSACLVKNAAGVWQVFPQIQPAAALLADAPAGGTGATAGAYDTAAHRDTMIALVNGIKAVLVARGWMLAE